METVEVNFQYIEFGIVLDVVAMVELDHESVVDLENIYDLGTRASAHSIQIKLGDQDITNIISSELYQSIEEQAETRALDDYSQAS